MSSNVMTKASREITGFLKMFKGLEQAAIELEEAGSMERLVANLKAESAALQTEVADLKKQKKTARHGVDRAFAAVEEEVANHRRSLERDMHDLQTKIAAAADELTAAKSAVASAKDSARVIVQAAQEDAKRRETASKVKLAELQEQCNRERAQADVDIREMRGRLGEVNKEIEARQKYRDDLAGEIDRLRKAFAPA